MVANSRSDKLEDYTDSQLADLIKSGNADAFAELTARYMSLIRLKASPFRCTMLEADDLCQEGLWGLLCAARTFEDSGKANFRTYAGVCISNRVIMAYRSAASRKNSPLNNSLSLNDDCLEIDISDSTANPEAVLMGRESVKAIRLRIEQNLSKMEQQVLVLYLSGCSYHEVAVKLGITSKAVDNALQRIRSKLK